MIPECMEMYSLDHAIRRTRLSAVSLLSRDDYMEFEICMDREEMSPSVLHCGHHHGRSGRIL